MHAGIASPPQSAGKVKRRKILRRKFGTVPPATLSVPKVTLNTISRWTQFSTKSDQRLLPTLVTHVCGTVTDVNSGDWLLESCLKKQIWWQQWWAREQTGAEKLLCDEKWACGAALHACRLQ